MKTKLLPRLVATLAVAVALPSCIPMEIPIIPIAPPFIGDGGPPPGYFNQFMPPPSGSDQFWYGNDNLNNPRFCDDGGFFGGNFSVPASPAPYGYYGTGYQSFVPGSRHDRYGIGSRSYAGP